MGCISDFGTGFAARTKGLAVGSVCAAVLIVALPAPTFAAAESSVSITLTGLRNSKGHVLLCVTSNPKAFPDCRKDTQAARLVLNAKDVAAGEVTHVTVEGPGTYAIAAVHDENGNGKLDTVLMMPHEGFGFSRNPAIRFGPPKFKNASFAVGTEVVTQKVKMKYML